MNLGFDPIFNEFHHQIQQLWRHYHQIQMKIMIFSAGSSVMGQEETDDIGTSNHLEQ